MILLELKKLIMAIVGEKTRDQPVGSDSERKRGFNMRPVLIFALLAIIGAAIALSSGDKSDQASTGVSVEGEQPRAEEPAEFVIPPEDEVASPTPFPPPTATATTLPTETTEPLVEIPIGPSKPEFTKNYSNAGVPLPEDGVKTASWFARVVNAASNRSTPNNMSTSSARQVRPDWVGDPTLSEQFLNYLLEFKNALETGSRLPDIGTMPTGIFFPIIPNEEDYLRKITITDELVRSAIESGTEIRLRAQGRGIVINPSENLLAKAQEAGWTIIRISENGDYIVETDPNISMGISGFASSVWAAYGKDAEQLEKRLKTIGSGDIFIIY